MADDTPAQAWHEIVAGVLKRHKVDLVTYVPDNVLRPLLDLVHADPFFTAFAVAREEEGLGINAGAWMGGRRGILMMQTSGFATLANALASLSVPFQIPSLMLVSERGTMGEFNIGQQFVARTMRPVLDTLLIENHTLRRLDDVEFVMDRSITQAFATQAPCCFILSPLLTGGKVFAK
jgi:sulfopyruvate decarboxylase alpha subunit